MDTGSATPKPECDLIMKGGITSGVVYPALIFKLCRKYRFASIGGTSAGAIAAALTAAAELGREKGGFEKFLQIAEQLRQPGFLLHLFQPNKASKPLMDLGIEILNLKKTGRTWIGMLFSHLLPGLLAGLVLAILLCFVTCGLERILLFLLVVPVAGVLGLYPWLAPIVRALQSLPRQGFGICSGRTDRNLPEYRDQVALTDWLAAQLKSCAGIEGSPLIFQDLWDKPQESEGHKESAKQEASSESKEARETKQAEEGREAKEAKGIDLQMFTSNLSQGQPYVFPLSGNELFLFQESEFREYFGDEVTDHMVKHSEKVPGWQPPAGFHFFPPPGQFPVIVATRMSLSFPFLFRAVPVYTLPADAVPGVEVKAADLQLNWFSDGGICSNFPIHFFDAWVPTRPTFGVNLTSFGPESMSADGGAVLPRANVRQKEKANEKRSPDQEAVFLPKADEVQSPHYKEIEGLLGFAGSILETAKDCHDNQQSALPSYRERIVQIRLKKDEGGLNLVMPKDAIEKVIKKGEKAGYELSRFELPPHQWVRLRVLLPLLAKSLGEMHEDLNDIDKDTLFTAQAGFPFSLAPADAQKLKDFVQNLDDHLDYLPEDIPGSEIKPGPVLRVVPQKL